MVLREFESLFWGIWRFGILILFLQSCYIALANFKLIAVLLPPPKGWGYRHVPPCLSTHLILFHFFFPTVHPWAQISHITTSGCLILDSRICLSTYILWFLALLYLSSSLVYSSVATWLGNQFLLFSGISEYVKQLFLP